MHDLLIASSHYDLRAVVPNRSPRRLALLSEFKTPELLEGSG